MFTFGGPAALFFAGFLVGGFGTMIGAGGGFLLVPLLLFLYPTESPEILTAISLAVVCCNAASGTVAYGFKGRVDWRSAWPFALASLPGAILGAYATQFLSRQIFDPLFGLGLIAVGIYLATVRSQPEAAPKKDADPVGPSKGQVARRIQDREGHRFAYAFNFRLGMLISAGVGFFSSVLGIGGGILHVPALVYALGFPVHIATATSHAILAAMTFVATVQHGLTGSLQPGLDRLLYLAPGVILGAPIGAKLSQVVRGNIILHALALALIAVGARLVLPQLW